MINLVQFGFLGRIHLSLDELNRVDHVKSRETDSHHTHYSVDVETMFAEFFEVWVFSLCFHLSDNIITFTDADVGVALASW